jgi:predicted nucleic acid-binding protein
LGEIGIDANILLCILLPEATKTGEENVKGSERLLRSLGPDNLAVTSSIVFAEVAWAFLREEKEGAELEAARQVIESIAGLKIIPVDNDIAWQAGKLRRKHYSKKLQISYQDAIYLATCIRRGVEAFYTTDSHLLKAKEKVPIVEAKLFASP